VKALLRIYGPIANGAGISKLEVRSICLTAATADAAKTAYEALKAKRKDALKYFIEVGDSDVMQSLLRKFATKNIKIGCSRSDIRSVCANAASEVEAVKAFDALKDRIYYAIDPKDNARTKARLRQMHGANGVSASIRRGFALDTAIDDATALVRFHTTNAAAALGEAALPRGVTCRRCGKNITYLFHDRTTATTGGRKAYGLSGRAWCKAYIAQLQSFSENPPIRSDAPEVGQTGVLIDEGSHPWSVHIANVGHVATSFLEKHTADKLELDGLGARLRSQMDVHISIRDSDLYTEILRRSGRTPGNWGGWKWRWGRKVIEGCIMWAKEHLEQQYQAGLETQIAAQRGAGNGSTMFVQVEYLGWFQGTFRKEWLTVPAMTERLEALAANGGSGDDDYTGLGPDAGFDDGLDADEEDISFEERMRLSFVLVHRREPQQKELEDFMQTAYEEVETEKNVIERRIREQWGHTWGGG
jgi:hypothetical protein